MAVALRPRVALVGVPLALLITAAHLANDAFTNILPVFLPTLQQRFGLGEVALASLVAVISLSANVLQAFMGALTDRWGRRRAAALGLLVSSLLMSFVVVAPTVWALLAMLTIGGIGSAIFHPGAVAMMRDVGLAQEPGDRPLRRRRRARQRHHAGDRAGDPAEPRSAVRAVAGPRRRGVERGALRVGAALDSRRGGPSARSCSTRSSSQARSGCCRWPA
jgi:hypothetical protein